ncbi:FAD/NADP-binding domain-containing protein [Dacryopinax primogenitus]|uniref:FAD/NADP-binding domain-containing protein n=1 Tax=Dacryopinax primogenitus (strain DJM 731) TaxID=1858805 RepID=M5G7B7_DACPD|nr:FAD/NADP-binding domain-containing protein [Dacryopinax primogenitus]EJU01717.1 FAD/NADP-binding domain-containing protein [Dacryopinax primogenitus]
MVSPTQHPPSGIKVLIVGAGFGGITAAIECHNKGHQVIVLEAFPELKILGDVISLGPNAGRIIERWGNGSVARELLPITHNNKELVMHRFDGPVVTRTPVTGLKFGSPAFNGHRGELHRCFFRFAQQEGIDIRLNSRVVEYWEEPDKAGVVLESGEGLEADVVVGADGVKSKARQLVLGYDDKPRSSGYAIWRTWFTSEELAKDPLTKFFSAEDTHHGWIGPEVHFLAASLKGGKDVSWVCTHKDEKDIEESYQFPGKIEDVLKVVGDWDPVVVSLVKHTPEKNMVDWKLVYRDPLPTWISKGARICILGDAAHPFLPTSIQGASQAMEDGVVLACALFSAGKSRVPLGVRAYERIRYERCRRAQLMGESTRDKWHKADFDNLMSSEENMRAMDLPHPPWLFWHDAEKHTLDVFPEVAKDIESGKFGTDEIGFQTSVLRRENGKIVVGNRSFEEPSGEELVQVLVKEQVTAAL